MGPSGEGGGEGGRYINRIHTIILYVAVTTEDSASGQTESSDFRIKPWKGGLDCKGSGLQPSGINGEWD